MKEGKGEKKYRSGKLAKNMLTDCKRGNANELQMSSPLFH